MMGSFLPETCRDFFFFFFFFLGPEHMPQMHRSHVGLLCYPRTIQVFFRRSHFRY